MENTYSAAHVANFFIGKAKEEGVSVSPMKLLKLVYIGYGWSYALLDRMLFEEPVEAWQHGPVIVSLYHEFKHRKDQPIVEMAGDFDLETRTYIEPQIPNDDEQALLVLNRVWAIYKDVGAWALRNKTHEDGTPWSLAWASRNGADIPPASIKVHFQKKINEYLNVSPA